MMVMFHVGCMCMLGALVFVGLPTNTPTYTQIHPPHTHSDPAPTTNATHATLQALHAAAVAYASVIHGGDAQHAQHEWVHTTPNGGDAHAGGITKEQVCMFVCS